MFLAALILRRRVIHERFQAEGLVSDYYFLVTG
jgi:hypothetical protein